MNGWLVTLLNPAGADKPQQGFVVTRFEESRPVTISTRLAVKSTREWFTNADLSAATAGGSSSISLSVPAGGVRIVEIGM